MQEHEEEHPRNRVLIGLPERLQKANMALRERERLIENLKSVLAQRSILKDEIVLDNISELLGVEKRPSFKTHIVPRNCPACTGRGDGPFCSAHSWHNP